MADVKSSGMEESAISVLKRAVELDNERRFTESMVCYQEGIQLLLSVMKVTTEEGKKQRFRQRVQEYMGRAEKLKAFIEKDKELGAYHEQLQIENNSTGHSYQKVFGRFLDEILTVVEVEDPYIRNVHQIYNFLRFCEMLILSPSPVRKIVLTTGLEDNESAQSTQKSRISEIYNSLKSHSIDLEVHYSQTLHDREIRFNNGWVIKIGRGLDYFKPTPSKFSVGFCDHNLRQCHETTVDIFHKKYTKTAVDS